MNILKLAGWFVFCAVVGFAIAWLNFQYIMHMAVNNGDAHYTTDVDGNTVLEWE